MNLKQLSAAGLLGIMLVLISNDGVIADTQPEVTNSTNPVQVMERKQVSAYDALTHQQQVWINALEWCESKGDHGAINPNDVDNTPSYYSFQFKPSTFKYYGEKYNVIESGLSQETLNQKIKVHALQRDIVANMLNDRTVNMRQQFPACVRSLGLPKRFNGEMAKNKSVKSDEVSLSKVKVSS